MKQKARLIRILGALGKPCYPLRFADGSELLVLGHGGRVLGLFSADSANNFLWTNPAFQQLRSARSLFNSDGWLNSGGDRTWIAPEIDVFLPHYPRTDLYVRPKQLDPGQYQVNRRSGQLCLENDFALTFSRTKTAARLRLVKEFEPAVNPLRDVRAGAKEVLRYAGYTQSVRLSILSDPETTGPAGIWNLLQLPHGGQMIIPTFGTAQPRVIFGSVTKRDLAVAPQLVRFETASAGDKKISILSVHCTGRVGYVYPRGPSEWDLVVRNFRVNPSGEYVDVPWDAPEERGYAMQGCSINGELGCFTELEYHVPAIGRGTGRTSVLDVSQVWAFRGTPAAIQSALECLLYST